jgi:hypothetical protein
MRQSKWTSRCAIWAAFALAGLAPHVGNQAAADDAAAANQQAIRATEPAAATTEAAATAAAPAMPEVAEADKLAESDKLQLNWLSDYGAALKTAEAAKQPLVILFHNPADAEKTARFEREILTVGPVFDLLGHCTLAKLPHDLKIKAGGEEFELLKHAAFAKMNGRPGLAVVDTVHRESALFRHVVASLPTAAALPSQAALVALLERHVPAEALAKLAELKWHEDYGEAIKVAERERRMLFIYFHNESRDAEQDQFEREALASVPVRRKLGRFVLARLPSRAQIKVQDKPVKLLDHASFSTMYGRQGIAIVDTTDANSKNYRQVVSAFPFSARKRYDARRLSVILDLPRGTLTQRTLVYAVRTHPEAPASTDGDHHDMLAEEAESHSQHQADIDNQGHHNWGHRFQRISSRLPGGMVAVEVCAESWPGEELVDAAEECVNSWRQSSGHWGAVSARQPFFGYDMKLGSRAVWYATGIFGRH